MMINDNKDDKQQELKRQTQLHSELIKGEVTAAQTAIWIAAPTTLGRVVLSAIEDLDYTFLFISFGKSRL